MVHWLWLPEGSLGRDCCGSTRAAAQTRRDVATSSRFQSRKAASAEPSARNSTAIPAPRLKQQGEATFSDKYRSMKSSECEPHLFIGVRIATSCGIDLTGLSVIIGPIGRRLPRLPKMVREARTGKCLAFGSWQGRGERFAMGLIWHLTWSRFLAGYPG